MKHVILKIAVISEMSRVADEGIPLLEQEMFMYACYRSHKHAFRTTLISQFDFFLWLPRVSRMGIANNAHLFFRSVNVFLSMLAKPEFRLEMLVGSCTAWSMEFSLMARCPATRLSAEETIPSTHFLARLERENTFLAPCSLTWNQQLSVSYYKGKKKPVSRSFIHLN